MQPVAHNLNRFLPALCIGLYAAISLVLWVDHVWDPEWDGAIYLLTAESLARGDGYTYQGQAFFLRPPGMSWLLSHFVGPQSFDPYVINLLLTSFAIASVAAIFWAVREIHGRNLALIVALLAGTSPIFTGALNAVLSEFPFLAFFFAGIALLTSAARRESGGWVQVGLAALCLTAALYLRTVAILVLPGVLLLGWRRPRMRLQALAVVAVVAALGAPWILHSRAVAAQAEVPSEQLFLHDYSTALFRVDPGDPGSDLVDLQGWLQRLRKNGTRALIDLSDLLRLGSHPAGRGLFLLLVLVGFVTALRRGPTLFEWLAPIYVALVLTYFTYAVRLTAPLAPLAYLYALLGVRTCVGLIARRAPSEKVGLAALGVGLALLASNSARIELPRPLSPAKQDQFAIADWVRENTPPDAKLLCNQAPVYELLSGRRCYTYRFLRQLQLLGRYDLDYVLLDQPHRDLLRALNQGPTERQIIRTENGSRIPVFRFQ